MSPSTKTGPEVRRSVANPWPRLILAAALLLWAGANLWTGIFQWRNIAQEQGANRAISIILTLAVTLIPLVVAIWLFRSVAIRTSEPHRPPGKKTQK